LVSALPLPLLDEPLQLAVLVDKVLLLLRPKGLLLRR
jgi:hypothetical protein